MGLTPRWILLAMLACPLVQAQIYECPGPDGSRLFSDKKCGPDAKVVKGIAAKPARAAKATDASKSGAAKVQKTAPRPAIELQQLLKLCDGGDDAACTKWTKGGGPNLLREQERQSELACEAGSLLDCESRYCRDGVTEDCRQRVLRTASVSGDTWYLRPDGRQFVNGSTTYEVRCVNQDEPRTRDITITCGATTGPGRCYAAKAQPAFSRLDQAAASLCDVTASQAARAPSSSSAASRSPAPGQR